MASRRIIIKKVEIIENGKLAANRGHGLKAWLGKYVNQVAKTVTERSVPGLDQPDGNPVCHNLTEESKGRLQIGGFLGSAHSPGCSEARKQRAWINQFASRWTLELLTRDRRSSDGLRFIIGVVPKALRDLTDSKLCVDQVMREIWEQTIGLYRKRHKLGEPGGELGWILGTHEDKGSTHIVIFPTTADGRPVRTDNEFEEMMCLANLAAETYWRENLDLVYQAADFRADIAQTPSLEPQFPSLRDFMKKGGAAIEKIADKKPERLTLNFSTVAKRAIGDTRVALGDVPPVSRLKHRGLCRLKSMVVVYKAFQKAKFWVIFRDLHFTKSMDTAVKAIDEEFQDVVGLIAIVAAELKRSRRPADQSLGGELAIGKESIGWAALDLAMGLADDPNPEHTTAVGISFAIDYESLMGRLQDAAIGKFLASKPKLHTASVRSKVRRRQYSIALREIVNRLGATSQAACILEMLSRGATRLGNSFDARLEEIETAIKGTADGFELRSTHRDWLIRNGSVIAETSEGPPWPSHFEVLAKGGGNETMPPSKPHEPVVSRISRVVISKHRARRQSLEREIEMPGQTVSD